MLTNNISRTVRLALAALGSSLLLQGAEAAVIQYSGSFSITFNTGAVDYQGVPELSGSWSFEFDDSVVAGNPDNLFSNVILTSISLNSAVGSTVYNTSNAAAGIQYTNGIFSGITIGGTAGGDESIIDFSNDDWFVTYSPSGVATMAFLNSGAVPQMQSGAATGSFTAVPEPGPSLIALALVPALAFLRKRSRA